jgi:hypothetical protein
MAELEGVIGIVELELFFTSLKKRLDTKGGVQVTNEALKLTYRLDHSVGAGQSKIVRSWLASVGAKTL